MFDLLQHQMSTSHTIRAHAQEVWDKSNKDLGTKGGHQSGSKVVAKNSKSDLPLVSAYTILGYIR